MTRVHQASARGEIASAGFVYFGYGSNLDRDDWRRFCSLRGFDPGGLKPTCAASLPNETLVFDYRSDTRQCGALNIRPCPTSAVDGYLFTVSDGGWAALDAKEGAPHRYRREAVMVLDACGREVEAQTYRVVENMRQSFVAPNSAYLNICRAGRSRYGLPTDQLERAALGQV